jgi:hypothetical protein
VGDVSKDDDFLNAAIMTINVEKVPKEYWEIIQYLDNMRFVVGATKVVRAQIVQKNQNYSIIKDRLYFQVKDGVLWRDIRKGETSCLLYEFHDGFYGGHFVGQIIV